MTNDIIFTKLTSKLMRIWEHMNTIAVRENRKDIIFKIAIQCFNEYGYYKTSMDMIAKKAQISKPGLYYHFKSKDELFLDAFEYINKKFMDQLTSHVSKVTDPEKRLLTFCKLLNPYLPENTEFIKYCQEMVALSIRKPEIRQIMTAYYREQVKRVQKVIDEGIDSGKFIDVDSEKTARAFVLITMAVYNVYFNFEPDFELIDQHTFNLHYMVGRLKKD